jgi:hypothetical protein
MLGSEARPARQLDPKCRIAQQLKIRSIKVAASPRNQIQTIFAHAVTRDEQLAKLNLTRRSRPLRTRNALQRKDFLVDCDNWICKEGPFGGLEACDFGRRFGIPAGLDP